MSTVRVTVPAKVNLHLQVLGRRPDGFREVRTLLQSFDLCDELAAEAAPAGVLDLEVEPPAGAPPGPENLVLRAARALEAVAEPGRGARLRLVKRIPMGAGLGGGSADAAAALLLLDRVWRTGLGARGLHGIAAELGSDVPFFLRGGLALGIGRGEEVLPLPDLPPLPLMVAAPMIQVPTPAVYARLEDDGPWCRPLAPVYDFYTGLTSELPWSSVRNDLQSAVITGWPEVGEALAELESTAPRHAAVTGSGAAVFAIYGDVGSARRAAAKLADRWWVHVGVTMPRDAARPRPDVTD